MFACCAVLSVVGCPVVACLGAGADSHRHRSVCTSNNHYNRSNYWFIDNRFSRTRSVKFVARERFRLSDFTDLNTLILWLCAAANLALKSASMFYFHVCSRTLVLVLLMCCTPLFFCNVCSQPLQLRELPPRLHSERREPSMHSSLSCEFIHSLLQLRPRAQFSPVDCVASGVASRRCEFSLRVLTKLPSLLFIPWLARSCRCATIPSIQFQLLFVLPIRADVSR